MKPKNNQKYKEYEKLNEPKKNYKIQKSQKN